MKKTLVYDRNDDFSFLKPWIKPLIEKHFNLQAFDPEKTYDPDQHIGIITHVCKHVRPELLSIFKQMGLRIVVDHLWESDVERTSYCNNNVLTVRCPNWMWYYTSLEFAYYGYQQYQPQRDVQHCFLMLMNNIRWHRDRTLEALAPLLPRALYSYVCREIYIPDDRPEEDTVDYWRFMNPKWYNSTAFSVVAESRMRNSQPRALRTEVSEKIFKPLAHCHPAVVYGSVDTLKYLHDQGFETFDTWFDQSYDSIVNDEQRFDAVTQQIFTAVDRWDRGEIGFDSETQRRLKHNQDHLFDHSIVLPRFCQEVIEPILQHAEN